MKIIKEGNATVKVYVCSCRRDHVASFIINANSQHHVNGCETRRSFSDVLPFGRLWYAEPDAVERPRF